MACQDFDGQVVRLEKIKELADKFVRVRLARVDNCDLNLFEFDYDLTFMVFFLDANENVYARYGGRDAEDPDNRQSLEGLKYTMEAVLAKHAQSGEKQFAPKSASKATYLRDLIPNAGGGHCLHCHQVKEALNRNLVKSGEWSHDHVWRYPLPENLGFKLEVNRGNVVQTVTANSPASKAGLQPGDVVQTLGKTAITSLGDAQYALDKAPVKGSLDIAFSRGQEKKQAQLTLADDWRRCDISWRPSMRKLVPSLPLYGKDLEAAERKELGLTEKQLAFRQKETVPERARVAGFQAGDIILGIAGKPLDMDVTDFLHHVRSSYLVGESITLLVRRGKEPLKIPIELSAR